MEELLYLCIHKYIIVNTILIHLNIFLKIINDRPFCVLKLADDRMALVSGISLDPEAAIGVTKKLPPKWIDGVDEVK